MCAYLSIYLYVYINMHEWRILPLLGFGIFFCHSEVSFSRQVRFAVWKKDWEGGGWIILQKMDDDGFLKKKHIYIYIHPILLYHMPPMNVGEWWRIQTHQTWVASVGWMWAVGYYGSQVAPLNPWNLEFPGWLLKHVKTYAQPNSVFSMVFVCTNASVPERMQETMPELQHQSRNSSDLLADQTLPGWWFGT